MALLDAAPQKRSGLTHVIAASSAGTIFEWYDFFLFGSLASTIAKHFFASAGETEGFILALLTFAAGFFARPFGAIVFGYFGDLTGRKRTFLITVATMGFATFAIGFLPGESVIGVAAPWLLVLLRVIQGFAVGGEYGGAAIYVAEHAPAASRGQVTGWIQVAASLGLILALGVIFITRKSNGRGRVRGIGAGAFRFWVPSCCWPFRSGYASNSPNPRPFAAFRRKESFRAPPCARRSAIGRICASCSSRCSRS